jgi:penicillin-binding protein 1B
MKANLQSWGYTATLAVVLSTIGVLAGDLESELGRNAVRVYSGAYEVPLGRTVQEVGLPERLDRLGYERVHGRPTEPGEYFWGHDVFWIYRRSHRHAGKIWPAELLGLRLRRADGRMLEPLPVDGDSPLRLEPELLAESLDGKRAQRRLVRIDDLPAHVWRAVLAAEDARFYDHGGVDSRALARALLANLQAGKAVQGGSTITQQLIKNRDLSPKKTVGRKVSEAFRALALEAEYDKTEILQAYLNEVYLGHVRGLAVHGLGTAARVYFSRPADRLTLSQSALLAGMIQGPNRLAPDEHEERARERRNWVLDRMGELGWAGTGEVAAAKSASLGVEMSAPSAPEVTHFIAWVASQAGDAAPKRVERGRGMVLETTLDPYLQHRAERVVRQRLERLRERYPRLRGEKLTAALVAVDARTGQVRAYVGGDPGDSGDRFDRARKARRQPGSAAKPLVLLEAFEDCGERKPLNPATRVADEPLRVDLPSGPWEPVNLDGSFHGVVDLRTATRHSYNVPFVRIAMWCDMNDVAARMRRAGLRMPDEPPPSVVLGAVEATPLEMAEAFTVFASPGETYRPYPVSRIERPNGELIQRFKPKRRRVVHDATAYLVRELLIDAVGQGTGRGAAIDGVDVAGKTGTSSSLRDAWFVGHAGGLVTAVWIGIDRDGNLGLTGGTAAAPLWRAFMERAIQSSADHEPERPKGVVTRYVDPRNGLLVRPRSGKGREEVFRSDAMPRRKRFWRRDRPEAIIY